MTTFTESIVEDVALTGRSVITKRVRNVFREGYLASEASCAKLAQVQTEGERTVTRTVQRVTGALA